MKFIAIAYVSYILLIKVNHTENLNFHSKDRLILYGKILLFIITNEKIFL